MGQAEGVRFCDQCGASLTAAEGRTVDDCLLCKRCTPRFLRLRAVCDHLRAWCRGRWLVAVMALILVGLVCALASTVTRTSVLESEVFGLESEVDRLKSGLGYWSSGLESKVDDLESEVRRKVRELEYEASKLKSKVDDLESKVRRLEYQIRS